MAASLRELWQPVGEIAESSTACHRDEPEGSDCDARAGIETVEEDNQHDHGCEREASESDSKHHRSSVDHARASITNATESASVKIPPRTKPTTCSPGYVLIRMGTEALWLQCRDGSKRSPVGLLRVIRHRSRLPKRPPKTWSPKLVPNSS